MYWTKGIFQHVVEEDECGLLAPLSMLEGHWVSVRMDDPVFCFGLRCKVTSSPSPDGCQPRLENYC